MPGGALPEASPGLGHLKAHSSPIVNRQAEDGEAVDTPGPRRLSGPFLVMGEVLSTIFHRHTEQTRLFTLYVYNTANISKAGSPCFCRQARAEHSQAIGLYVLAVRTI